MIKRSLRKTEINKKDDFLNPQQRKQLKEILIAKFTKLKGKGSEEIIRKLVENYFNSALKVNGKTIIELENKIKNEVKFSRGKVQQVQEQSKP